MLVASFAKYFSVSSDSWKFGERLRAVRVGCAAVSVKVLLCKLLEYGCFALGLPACFGK